MPPALRRLALLAAALAVARCGGPTEAPRGPGEGLRELPAALKEELPAALEEDGACGAVASGGGAPACDLSLRQLRARLQLAAAEGHGRERAEVDGSGDHLAAVLEPLDWTEAYQQAEEWLSYMEPSDKAELLRGIGWALLPGGVADLRKWWYVGNAPAIPRLNIPSLNMQDAAGGFRTYWPELVGTVTCWPSLLSLAATWSPEAVHEFAVALGREFSGKGANGILGPSIELHRVARGGRNFEYLSGEDPYLGSKLAEAYVKGVQSQGVFAVMKHWVFNNQETNRQTSSSIVDEKTAFELYYPPFKAAVDAGVSAAMCSYNRVNGTYSCQNEYELETVLKGRMGFRGFVQTDWWALHSNGSLAVGLDQDMPGWPVEAYFLSGFPATNQLAAQSPRAVDGAAKRILAVMARMKLAESTKCAPPYCEQWFAKNVTGAKHAALARRLAAESIVLLKNEGGILPLSRNHVGAIAIIGSAAVAPAYDPAGAGQGQSDSWSIGDYYSGGGSGHVAPGYVVTPLDGITARAAAGGIRVIASPTGNETEAIEAAKKADVAIIVAATTSGEGADRPNLNLDDGVDSLITAVAEHTNRTVVIAEIPGAVVMPWRDSVAAILSLFLGGQETGSAWADVLFGDHVPTGRLPLMMPATEADTIPPSTSLKITYSEGLATSYRNKNFTAAFPFGYGLTYTTFEYLEFAEAPCDAEHADAVLCVHGLVKNTGSMAAKAVVQLYLELPAAAGQPVPFLKGFQRTRLVRPGSSTTAKFALSKHDISYFNAGTSLWTMATNGTAYIGESSADVRQSLQLLFNADSQ